MGGDISEVRVSARFYQETKKAVADGVLTDEEKQQLQQIAEKTATTDDDSLVEFLEDSRNLQKFQQASAAGDAPAYIDIPDTADSTIRVHIQTPAEEAFDLGTFHLRASEVADAAGNKAQETSELEKAMTAYQQALQHDPNSVATHHQLGLVLFRLGRLDEAIAHYRRALELGGSESHPVIYSNLGLAYARKGNLELARENLEKAAEKLPQHLDTQYMLAITYQKLGQSDQALARFRQVLELDTQGRYREGSARKVKALAEEAYKQFKQTFDQPADQRTRLAATDRAIAAYELLKRLSPGDFQVDYNLGQLHYFRAMSSYTEDRIIGYDYPKRSYANDEVRGHLNKAAEYFQAVIKSRPGVGEAHYFLGKIQNIRAEAQPAARSLEEAVKLLPGDPDVHEEKAKNLGLQRRWQEAQQSYEKAIELVREQLKQKPNDTDLKKHLSRLLVDLSGVYYQRAYAASEVYPEEFRKAMELNNEALQVDPTNEMAQRNVRYLSRLTLEGPLFEETSERYLTNKAATAFHFMSYYGGMAMAAQAPDAKPEVKEHWAQLQEHINGITGNKDVIPISFLSQPKEGSPRIYHLPLVGGTTAEGKYRIVDPLTNRYYEGKDRAEAMNNFLAENKYPQGKLRYVNDQGQLMERRLSGPDHTADGVATAWTVVALAALAGSIIFPPAAPVLVPVAASGLLPGTYFAVKGGIEIADRLEHGQKVTWDMWVLEATQVVGVLLGVGAFASALGGGARAAGALGAAGGAAAGTGEVAAGMTAAQRFVAIQRFLLAANIVNDAAAAAAMGKQLMDMAGRTDISDDEKMATIFRTLGTLILSTGMNVRNLQSLGGFKGMQRLATLDDAAFQRFMSLPEDQRRAFFSLSDDGFSAALKVPPGELQKAMGIPDVQTRAGVLELMARGIDFGEAQKALKSISDQVGTERAVKLAQALPKDPGESLGTLKALQEDNLTARFAAGFDEARVVSLARNTAALRAPSAATPLAPEAARAIVQKATILENPSPPGGGRPLTRDFLLEKGLEPKHTVQIGDKKVHLSVPYDHNRGRTACVAYIEAPDGTVTIRTFYRSNSQGVWRSASHWSGNGHIGKGMGEETTNLPLLLQKELNRLADGDIKRLAGMEDANTAFYGGLPEGGYLPPRDFSDGVTGTHALADGDPNRTVRSPRGNNHALPDTLDFKHWKDPGNQPDFSRPVATSRFRHPNPAIGEVDTYVYYSKDGKYQYMFYKDSKNRTWVGSIESLEGGINGYGVKTNPVKSGDLTTPAVEYGGGPPGRYQPEGDQIPEGYKGDHVTGPYWDASRYVHSLEIVRKFREAIGLTNAPVFTPATAGTR